jgi:hypothetical protein
MEHVTCKVDTQGRITLPLDWRREQKVASGSQVVLTREDGVLRIETVGGGTGYSTPKPICPAFVAVAFRNLSGVSGFRSLPLKPSNCCIISLGPTGLCPTWRACRASPLYLPGVAQVAPGTDGNAALGPRL